MEVKIKLGYLYKHIRLDNNEVFYIGIGGFNKNEKENTYVRAYSKKSRNKDWYNIISMTDYKVEIVMYDLTFEETLFKEREFINFYGRLDLRNGTLVNKTSGGQGSIARISSEETKKKISNYHKSLSAEDKLIMYEKNKSENKKKRLSELYKGKPRSKEVWEKINKANKMPKTDETRKKLSEAGKRTIPTNKKQVLCVDKSCIYSSISEASIKLGINRKCISFVCNGKTKSAGGMKFIFID